MLTNSADALTVNMVLTVRKTVSLIASIVLFGNTFTLYHTLGTACVFGGAVLYSLITSAPPAPHKPKAA